MKTYRGSCDCKKVTFEAPLDLENRTGLPQILAWASRALLTLFLLVAGCGIAAAGPEALPAEASFTLGPSDGAALLLTVEYEGKQYNIRVWDKGLEMVREGKPVLVEGRSKDPFFHSLIGEALSCTKGEKAWFCDSLPSGTVELRLPANVIDAITPVPAEVVISGKVVPIQVAWRGSNAARLGRA